MLENYNKVKDQVLHHLSECTDTARNMGLPHVASQLEQSAIDIRNLRFNIAIVGSIKRGKSTLLNTLLGQDSDVLSTIDFDVCTGSIIHYMDISCLPKQDTPHARIYFYGKKTFEPIELEQIKNYITEAENPGNRRNVARVEIYGEFPLLHSCCLVDTPGANAVNEQHGEMVYDFLPKADAVIMTVMVDQPCSQSELDILKVLAGDSERRIFYVLTKVDNQDPVYLPEICGRVRKCATEQGLKEPQNIYLTAAKRVFDARCRHADQAEIEALKQKWGMAELEEDLENFILKSSVSGQIMVSRLNDALSKAKEAFMAKQKENEALIATQDVDMAALQSEKKRILAEFAEAKKKIEKKLQDFERKWDRITERAVEGLAPLVPNLEARVEERISNARGIKAIKNAFSLGKVIRECIQVPIAEYTEKTADKYNKLIEQLDEEIQEEINLCYKRWQGVSLVSAGGGIGAIAAAAATVPSACAAGALVVANASAWLTAAGNAMAVAETAGTFQSFLAIFGFGTVAESTKAAAAAWAALTTSISAAIIPVILAVSAMYFAGPLAKWFSNLALSSNLEAALEEAGKKLRKQAEINKTGFVSKIQEQLDNLEEQLNDELNQVEEKLAAINPEVKALAMKENEAIIHLLEHGAAAEKETLLIA